MTDLISAQSDIALVVAWGVATDTGVQGGSIKIAGDIEKTLFDDAVRAANSLTNGHTWGPDVDMEDATHLVASRADLLDTDLVSTLENGSALPLVSGSILKGKTLSCYAVVTGEGADKVTFVRKRNPVKNAHKTWATFLDGALSEVTEPLVTFDGRFDVIITQDQIFVLDKRNFELLFRDSAAVIAKTDDWVKEFEGSLPIFAASRDGLVADLKRNSFHRAKFHAILKRPYISTLTTKTLSAKMKAHGFDPKVLMPNGELDFSTANIRPLLRLLNEDLFFGDFSNEQYAASGKRPYGT